MLCRELRTMKNTLICTLYWLLTILLKMINIAIVLDLLYLIIFHLTDSWLEIIAKQLTTIFNFIF